jgi:hypothetical protein
MEIEIGDEIAYQRRKIALCEKLSVEEWRVFFAQCGDDYINDLKTMVVVGYINERVKAKRTVTYTFNRPKFTEWLFRKKRTFNVDIVIKEVLLNDGGTSVIAEVNEND